MPVAASAPTIRCSNHFEPVPIAPVKVFIFVPRRDDTARGKVSQIAEVAGPVNDNLTQRVATHKLH